MNIAGKRSGQGFVCNTKLLASGLANSQSVVVDVLGVAMLRKGFLNYLRRLSGGMVKIVPNGSNNGDASDSQVAKALRIACGSTNGKLTDGAWLTDDTKYGSRCQLRVSPNDGIIPNVGSIELAEALSRVLPFVRAGKDESSATRCIRFIQADSTLKLVSSDGHRLAEVCLKYEPGEADILIESAELRGIVSGLRKARRLRVILNEGLHIHTEAIRYRWSPVELTFPNYRDIIPQSYSVTASVDTAELMRACQSINALSVDKEAPVILTIGEGMVKVSSQDNSGETIIPSETDGSGEIALNCLFFTQALKAAGGMAEVKMSAANKPMAIVTDDYYHLLMPVNVGLDSGNGEKEAAAVGEAVEVAPETPPDGDGGGEAAAAVGEAVEVAPETPPDGDGGGEAAAAVSATAEVVAGARGGKARTKKQARVKAKV